jgi:hypothetical protein
MPLTRRARSIVPHRLAEARLDSPAGSRSGLSPAAILLHGGRRRGDDPMRRAGRKGLAAPSRASFGRPLFWILVLVGAWWPMPVAIAQTPAPTIAPAEACVVAPDALCLPPAQSGPQAWGVVGFAGYASGLRPAPNGLSYDPLLSLFSDINLGLLPNKRLYLFLDNGFGVQRTAPASSGVSQREFDAVYGLAWNYWDSLEFRVFGYALNNLNRGTSLASPEGFKDGIGLESRYYFPYADIYDVSRLGYIALGYYPSQALVGNNGQSFKPSFFARGYLTRTLPTRFTSYLYGGIDLTGENSGGLRLIAGDVGIAIRPIADMQNLEFRAGDAVTDDLKAGLTWNYVYAAARIGFETGPSSARQDAAASWAFSWPETWGDVGLPVYVASSHMAPNGVPFAPLFSVTSDLNLGLLPKKQLYLFWDSNFWAQHSGAGITNAHQGGFDFSKREIDTNLGLAWNYFNSLELRASLYALNNLNRGASDAVPLGGKQGIVLENRYNFASIDPYDVGRLSFIGFGYIPTEDLVNVNGASFRPGPFARAYLTHALLIPWFRSYLYAGMQVTAEHTGAPRLFESDVGWAVRPVARWQNLEFRIGDDLSLDIAAPATRNLVYGAIRINFGPGEFGRFLH